MAEDGNEIAAEKRIYFPNIKVFLSQVAFRKIQ